MIKFQKDHTTPEQSKRLLELGIPADSANCTRNLKTGLILAIPFKPSVFKERKEFFLYAYPCWSALRLMEIIDICALGENSDSNTEEYPSTIKIMNKLHIPYVEYLVKSIERAVQLGIIDFSKLDIQ